MKIRYTYWALMVAFVASSSSGVFGQSPDAPPSLRFRAPGASNNGPSVERNNIPTPVEKNPQVSPGIPPSPDAGPPIRLPPASKFPATPISIEGPGPMVSPPAAPAPSPSPTIGENKSAVTAGDDLTLEHLQQELKEYETSDPNDATAKKDKQNAVNQLKQAIKLLAESAEGAKKSADLRAEQDRIPQKIRDAKLHLSEPVSDARPQFSRDASLAEIEQQLRHTEDSLKRSKELLAEKEELLEVKSRNRQAELTKLIAAEREELDQTEKALDSVDASSDAASVQSLELRSRQRKNKNWLAAFDAEKDWWETVNDLLPLERDLAQRDVASGEKLLEAWRMIVDQTRARESQREIETARQMTTQSPPVLRPYFEQNVALAERQLALNESLKRATSELDDVSGQLDHLDADFSKLKEKVEAAGVTPILGQQMRVLKGQLPSARVYQQRSRFTSSELQRVQSEILELEGDRAGLRSLGVTIDRQIVGLQKNSLNPNVASQLPAMEKALLAQRREFLDRFLADQGKYLNQLTDNADATRRLLNKINDVTTFVDEHSLWVRTAAPLRMEDFTAAAQAAPAWWQPATWRQVAADIGTSYTKNKPLCGGLFTVFGCWLLLLIPIRRRIVSREEHQAATGKSHFWQMVRDGSLTLIVAAYWPALFLVAGWWLTWSQEASDLTLDLAAALRATAPLLFALKMVREACRSRGLAERHFGVEPNRLQRVRKPLRWLTLIGVPLVLMIAVSGNFGENPGRDALGRLFQIGGLLLLAKTLQALFRPKSGAVWSIAEQQQVAPNHRWRRIAHGLAIAVPISLIVVLALGYVALADRLLVRLEQTLWMGLVLTTSYAILMRCAVIYCGHLFPRGDIETAEETVPHAFIPEPHFAMTANNARANQHRDDLAEAARIYSRLRNALRGAALISMAVTGLSIWNDVFPAIREVGNTPLGGWTKTAAALDGGQQSVAVTLGDLLLGIATFVGSALLTRCIPDVLRMSFFRHLGFDRGAQFALALMCRYIISIVGIILAVRPVGITWSSVQWLVAAMTVGLGFGLQEIFANFVAGIIVLFERPIRLGDVITVNGTTGKVTRMQIRATTITDSDRRELIVPNKKFITDEIINWTLSDSTTRIVIPVKISYESDPARSADILMSLASEHPLVLKDPAPNAVFKGFGDKNLDLELRVFIGSGDVYFPVLHDLNLAIDQAMREARLDLAGRPTSEVRVWKTSNDTAIAPPTASSLAGKPLIKRQSA